MPVFFVVTGLGVDVGGLGAAQCLELALIVAVACAGKLLGAVAPAKFFGLSWAESRTLGLLVNTRGLTELIILNGSSGVRVSSTTSIAIEMVSACRVGVAASVAGGASRDLLTTGSGSQGPTYTSRRLVKVACRASARFTAIRTR
ncbi:hypothetical protein [Kitasatospora sp. NPDC094011]|uniref:hypothetical protein n=1 Tax=Kitasatospora sp. NPDC094011 TaxID=3364090 RepID=UPI003805E8C4